MTKRVINLPIACPSSKLPSKPFFRMLVHSLYRHYFPPEMLTKKGSEEYKSRFTIQKLSF